MAARGQPAQWPQLGGGGERGAPAPGLLSCPLPGAVVWGQMSPWETVTTHGTRSSAQGIPARLHTSAPQSTATRIPWHSQVQTHTFQVLNTK